MLQRMARRSVVLNARAPQRTLEGPHSTAPRIEATPVDLAEIGLFRPAPGRTSWADADRPFCPPSNHCHAPATPSAGVPQSVLCPGRGASDSAYCRAARGPGPTWNCTVGDIALRVHGASRSNWAVQHSLSRRTDPTALRLHYWGDRTRDQQLTAGAQ